MAIIFDIDGNGAISPLTDAQLISRYKAGMRGAVLIFGAVGPGAVRTTADEIEGYIEGIWNYLDADGDGVVSFGDVLMIQRRMFGFFGEDLIDGAVTAGAKRLTAEEIAAYIDIFLGDIVTG